MPFPARSFTGPGTGTGLYACGPISGTGLCQFRYGHFLGPVLELASICVVPFPVPGYAISGTVVFRVPYGTGIYVGGPISGTGLCQYRYGHF
jgi:hypothetical protein